MKPRWKYHNSDGLEFKGTFQSDDHILDLYIKDLEIVAVFKNNRYWRWFIKDNKLEYCDDGPNRWHYHMSNALLTYQRKQKLEAL